MPKKLINISIYCLLIFMSTSCEPEIAKPPKKQTSVNVISVNDRYKRNIYSAVKIGTQYWFQGNLNTSVYTTQKYDNGRYYDDTIKTYLPNNFSLLNLPGEPFDTLACQWPFNGVDTLAKKYGRMYTWYAVADARNICPAGWHVPTEAEWDKMIEVLGGDSLAGGKMKDTSNIEWNYPNLAEVNTYKLNVMSTGYRTEFGSYVNQGRFTFFWSSSSDPDDKELAIAYAVYSHSKKIYKQPKSKRIAMSIRCVR